VLESLRWRGISRAVWAPFYVRIDSIEEALLQSGKVPDELDDAGYRVGYAIRRGQSSAGSDCNCRLRQSGSL